MEMIFKAQKIRPQSFMPAWQLYIVGSCLLIVLFWFHREYFNPVYTIFFIIPLLSATKSFNRSDIHLSIKNDYITFRDARSISWQIPLSKLRGIECTPAQGVEADSGIKLVSLLFTCNDGDSYSMWNHYFSEQQVNEMKALIEQHKALAEKTKI